ncbi:ferric reductase-like transmembrane domain-containing protein [Streptomyces sp. 21So2-11]
MTAAALILIPLLAVLGSESLRATLDFTTGVLSLISLTASVAWGLLARDRLLLQPRHRLLAQGMHRATAIASLGFLLLHATVKVSLGHVELIGALIPFGLGISGTSGLIGLGSLAGFLMVVAASTGALRSAFATPGKTAGRWRAVHMVAYPAWASALIHGLYAGRPAATWVVTMYSLSLLAVVGALSLRLLPPPVKRTVADRIVDLVASGSVRQAPDPGPRDAALSPLPGSGQVPSQGQPGPQQQPQQQQLFRPQPDPHRLAPPAPPLYEAGPSRAVGYNSAPDTGISAAYRAVSGPGPSSDPFSSDSSSEGFPSAPYASAYNERIPLAEQIPMTEEIPVQSAPPSGRWPTPSPPPPAPAVRPPYPPTRPAYDPDRAAYGPGSVPAPDLPGYDPEAPTGLLPRSLDDTEPPPGPLFPPTAGEPWHAPAGDRR